MKKFSTSVDINASTEQVWQVMSDTERWHEWTPSIISVTRLDGELLSVGSRFLIRQPKFPRALWTVTMVEPGKSFAWVSVAPGLRVIGYHCIEISQSGATRATLSLDLQGIFGGAWGILTGKITEQYIALEARGLKARSEDPNFHL